MSHESCVIYMIPGSKGLNPHELAHRWGERPWDPPRYEHKSGMIIPRYANIGGELWDCVARNNSQVSKSGTFAPTSYICC